MGDSPALTGRARPVPADTGQPVRTSGWLRNDGEVGQEGPVAGAAIPVGRRQDVHDGRVVERASGFFTVRNASGSVQGVSRSHCRIIRPGDGPARLGPEHGVSAHA